MHSAEDIDHGISNWMCLTFHGEERPELDFVGWVGFQHKDRGRKGAPRSRNRAGKGTEAQTIRACSGTANLLFSVVKEYSMQASERADGLHVGASSLIGSLEVEGSKNISYCGLWGPLNWGAWECVAWPQPKFQSLLGNGIWYKGI